MDEYIDEGTTGCTELRVHGVSGATPETMLHAFQVHQVSGDAKAGFYRRVWENRTVSQDTKDFRREAYSWRALTSGSSQRALWLLLLPFMLVNMACYMGRKPSGKVKDFAQKLLALSLTGTYVLSVISASMDLVGWQCGMGPVQGRGQRCAGGAGWLRWLGYSWLRSPGRHLAVTALIPLAMVGLLWYLANATWSSSEAQLVPQSSAAPQVDSTNYPLEDRALWNGRAPVRRLRALHIMGAFALVGVFILAPLLLDPQRGLSSLFDGVRWSTPLTVARSALMLIFLAELGFVLVAVAVPATGRRPRPHLDETLPDEHDWFTYLPWFALVCTVCAGVVAWWPSADSNRRSSPSQLPWEVSWIHGLFSAQAVLLLVLLSTQLADMIRGRSRQQQSSGESATAGEPATMAWGGFALVGVASLGWLLAGALAAGLTLRVAQTLGTPTAAGQTTTASTPLLVPTAYFWAATASLVVVGLGVVIAGFAWLKVHHAAKGYQVDVKGAYKNVSPKDRSPRRLRQIARCWASADQVERTAQIAGGVFTACACGVIVACAILYVAFGTKLVTSAPQLVTFSNLILTALVVALLWAGHQAYSKEGFRRRVGVLWDIGTFWPRAVHPFAPPCYAERTVPELLTRLEYLTSTPSADPGHVILSCHSQGTIIGAAVLFQAKSDALANTSFLTYGSPLRRLYARFFPAYFRPEALEQLRKHLTTHFPAAPDDRAGNEALDGQASIACGGEKDLVPCGEKSYFWWRNLYRPSDPIGGRIFSNETPVTSAAAPGSRVTSSGVVPVDEYLLDPKFFNPPAGYLCYPAPLAHSNYFDDKAFDLAVNDLRIRSIAAGLLNRRVCILCPPAADHG